METASRIGLTGLIGTFLIGLSSPGFAAHKPITIAVGDIQSVGGEQGFCPSKTIRQELIQKLSTNSAYSVISDPQPTTTAAVIITGSINCSLEKQLRQRGFPLLQEQFTITTARVNVQLKLTNPATGAVVATPVAQAQAQSETQAEDLGNPLSEAVSFQGDTLFTQATTLALDKVILQVQNFPAMTPKTALERLFNAASLKAEWFTPAFLSQVPMTQVQQIITSIKAELGTYQEVQSEGGDYRIVFERGDVPAQISLNANGQISGLFFQPARLKFGQLSDIVTAFKALPGQVSLVVLEDGTERVALNANQTLAVGSTFKLAVLAALKQQIQAGQHSWGEVVPLQAQWKSLPSGILQTWSDSSLLTVQSLAALMISQSDNTATDHLIHLVGREAIEAITPRNRPFLTTREAFILKSQKNSDLLRQYQAGDQAARRQLLQTLVQQPLPNAGEFTAEPAALDVEWFFTTTELCNLMGKVKDLPLMSINPGVAQPQDWERIAYKGGSEPGVLNLTTGLRAKNGKQYCVSATWNNTAVLNETHFLTLYTSLLAMLK